MSKLNTQDILKALANRHPLPEWVFVEELRFGVGFQNKAHNERRIDAWAICCYPSKMARISYEVKVSRADFLLELKKPRKRAAALRVSNEYYFATPKNLIKPEELPPETGLIEIDEGIATIKEKAPWRDVHPPTWSFMASAMRRCVTLKIEDLHCAKIDKLKGEKRQLKYDRDKFKSYYKALQEDRCQTLKK